LDIQNGQVSGDQKSFKLVDECTLIHTTIGEPVALATAAPIAGAADPA